jgi:hypothetical protein
MERTALLLQFQQLAPVPGSPINDYFAKLVEIRNRLAGTAQAVTDAYFKVQLYRSLPPEFRTTMTYQQNLPDDTPIETIMDNLKRDELLRSLEIKPAATTEALYSNTSRGRGRGRGRGGRKQFADRWCTHCNRNNHNTEDCWNPDISKDSKKRDYEEEEDEKVCWTCGESGHMTSGCPIKRKGDAAKVAFKKKRTEKANLAVGTRSVDQGL